MDVGWEESGWERLAAGVGRRRLPGWDATVGLVVGDDAALLFDAGSTLGEGARIRAQVQGLLGGRRVTHIALSHPHFDHVLGAAAFAGAQVFGAVGLDEVLVRERDALRADAVREGVAPDEAGEAVDVLVHPHHLVCGEWTLDLGGRQVLLANVGPGHTGHDLALLVPGAAGDGPPEVVFCGDLVEESGEPQAGPDAIPSCWPAALDRLLELGGRDALYVPGHGAVVDAAFVRAQRDELARRFAVS
ncbi:MBL fold metallo-hydrolase [Streptomyces roseolilacinus]|uniref:MBL fold hydrolase n=1 Tax=Streptomyces roseolilacinus TaxID=66904 RepID=A0A918B1I8_9ACTN|nr:MBL fold metallo-hydrolase [Streptomyces roseolilacinus]GGQ14712.1 MBL fold hydrolase [Streptomyces roseolilacinus]